MRYDCITSDQRTIAIALIAVVPEDIVLHNLMVSMVTIVAYSVWEFPKIRGLV